MRNFLEYFDLTYKNKLLSPAGNNPVRDRYTSLRIAFAHLQALNLDRYHIIETGTLRPDHGNLSFGDDGASTIIFDDFINYFDGSLISVDINQINVNHAKKYVSSKSYIVCDNSIPFINNLPSNYLPNLVYLDSYDISFNNPLPSQIHHLKELCAIFPRLKKNTLLLIDDHDAFFTNCKVGKGNLVKEFLYDIGVTPIFEGYQLLFKF